MLSRANQRLSSTLTSYPEIVQKVRKPSLPPLIKTLRNQLRTRNLLRRRTPQTHPRGAKASRESLLCLARCLNLLRGIKAKIEVESHQLRRQMERNRCLFIQQKFHKARSFYKIENNFYCCKTIYLCGDSRNKIV